MYSSGCFGVGWGTVEWVLLDKEMLLGQHRVIVATSRRALSDLFISRGKLRSERSDHGKKRVSLQAVQRVA